MESICIGKHRVGQGEPVFVIAEIGSNHGQNWDQTTRLIDAAVGADADAVKFQVYTAEDLYPKNASVFDLVKSTELPQEWIPRLAEYSNEMGVMFFASAFSNNAVDRLAEIDVPVYKCASSDLVNLPLLKYMASKGKPLVLATGMSNLADIYEAITTIQSEGVNDVCLLQCTSLYPTEPRHVHLRAMDTLRLAFNIPVGISDHTLGVSVPIAAVARGACIIEKHLTINRDLPGPDHSYALEPEEFKEMVEGISIVEDALGCPSKVLLPEEEKLARRMSIRAARDIQANELLSPELLEVTRPAGGVQPRFLAVVTTCKAIRPISKGEKITWDMIRV